MEKYAFIRFYLHKRYAAKISGWVITFATNILKVFKKVGETFFLFFSYFWESFLFEVLVGSEVFFYIKHTHTHWLSRSSSERIVALLKLVTTSWDRSMGAIFSPTCPIECKEAGGLPCAKHHPKDIGLRATFLQYIHAIQFDPKRGWRTGLVWGIYIYKVFVPWSCTIRWIYLGGR